MPKACRTISNLSFTKSLLILLILWSQKNAALQDLEIWVDMEKLESNAHFRHGLNVCCANTDRTRINFQQLLLGSHLVIFVPGFLSQVLQEFLDFKIR